jgi:predicted RNase H-like HicB family nuclease
VEFCLREYPAVELERESDGRWIAELPAIPGAIVYGASPEDAVSKVWRLATDVIADRQLHGETVTNLKISSW